MYANIDIDFPGGFSGGELLAGIAEVKGTAASAVKMYYNNQQITIENLSQEPKEIRVYILNVLGNTMFSTNLSLTDNSSKVVNVPELPVGLYIAQTVDVKNQHRNCVKFCAGKF